MSNCQEKPINDETATAAENPIDDVLLSMTTISTTTVRIFFSLRHMGVGQHDALITSTSLVWLMSWYR